MFLCIGAEIGRERALPLSEKADRETAKEALSLAKAHDVAHLAAHKMLTGGLIDGSDAELTKEATELYMSAVFRYGRRKYEADRAFSALSSAGMDYMPLKGAVIETLYPEPWMRTSCDIDILIRPENLGGADAALGAAGFVKIKDNGSHEITYKTDSGVFLELHFTLVEEGRFERAVKKLEEAWDTAARDETDPHRLIMREDLFFLYHLTHAAKHVENGGCGIRPIIDLDVIERSFGVCAENRKDLLVSCGLYDFCVASEKLMAHWLDGKPADGDTEMFEEYLLGAGTYGISRNGIAISQIKNGGRLGHLFKKAFLPYCRMKVRYPVLVKAPVLLPFCWVIRCFYLVFGRGRKNAINEIKTGNTVDRAERSEAARLISYLGL